MIVLIISLIFLFSPENLRILSLGRNNIKSLTGLVSSAGISIFHVSEKCTIEPLLFISQ